MTERLMHFQDLATAHEEVSQTMWNLYRDASMLERLEMDVIIYRLTWRQFSIECG